MQISIHVSKSSLRKFRANAFHINEVFTDGKRRFLSTTDNLGELVQFIEIHDDGQMTVPVFEDIYKLGSIYYSLGKARFELKE